MDEVFLLTIWEDDLIAALVEWLRNGYDPTDDDEFQAKAFVDSLSVKGRESFG